MKDHSADYGQDVTQAGQADNYCYDRDFYYWIKNGNSWTGEAVQDVKTESFYANGKSFDSLTTALSSGTLVMITEPCSLL